MSLDNRLRDELRTEAARLAPGLGDVTSAIRRGRRRRVAQKTAIGIVLAIAIAGPFALLQRQGTQPLPVASEPPPTIDASSTPTSIVPDPAPSSELPGMVVSGPEGIVVLADGEVVERLDVGPIMLAVEDLEGGHIIQIGVSASSITRLSSGASEIAELIVPQPDETLRLHETAMVEGSPTVVYTVRAGEAEPVDAGEELLLFNLDTGEQLVVGPVGGYESGPMRVSYAAEYFLLSMTAEGVTWFEFMDKSGNQVAVPGNPRPEEAAQSDFPVWVGHGDLSPDGHTMAFLRGSPRSEEPFHLVAVDLATGDEITAVPLDGARHDNVTRIEWDGQVAVVSFSDRTAVVVSTDGTVTSLEISGTVVLRP